MTDWSPVLALAALAGLAADFCGHVLAARFVSRPAPAVIAGFLAGLVVTLALTGIALLRIETEILYAIAYLGLNLATFFALAYGYFNFVNLNMTSLRIRLLQEFLESPTGLTREEVLSRYNSEELVRRRMARLTEQKHLGWDGDRFQTRRSILLPIARTLDTLKWVVLRRRNRLIAAAEKNDPPPA